MKNYLMFALLICATASMAFGQFGVVVDPAKVDVACPDDECHVAPVFMGEGGFVGELADGFDMANFVVTCGNTTSSGSAAGDGGGVVRQLFSMANGLACHDDDGSIQIHGLADGGWYWINDDMNSAVSPLIAKDALMGDEVMPTDPGGVTLTASDYGTYVKSGDRVGILPHFVPTAPVEIPEIPEPEAATVCMPAWNPYSERYYANDEECMLGDGGTTVMMTARTADGRSSEVTSVYRNPKGGSNISIDLDLWGNGSGHIAGGNNAHLGWNLPVPSNRQQPVPFQARWVIGLAASGSLGTGLADAGISLTPTGMKERLGPVKNVSPPAATGNDVTTVDVAGTVEREDGFHMDSTNAMPQCVQYVETVKLSGAEDLVLYHFAAANGGDPVRLQAGSAPGMGDSWSVLATWVATHNSDAALADTIKTVTVPNPGPDGELGNDDDEEITPATYQLPAVVCKTMQEKVTYYGGATITVAPNEATGMSYCNRNNSQTATVNVLAYDAQGMNDTTPAIAQYPPGSGWRTGLAGGTTLQVHCAQ